MQDKIWVTILQISNTRTKWKQPHKYMAVVIKLPFSKKYMAVGNISHGDDPTDPLQCHVVIEGERAPTYACGYACKRGRERNRSVCGVELS